MNRRTPPNPIKIIIVVLVFKLVISLDSLQPAQVKAILETEETQEQVTRSTQVNCQTPTPGESRWSSTSG